MYKVKNPYKECHIMDLNMIGVHEHRKVRVTGAEIAVACAPLLACAFLIALNFMPELSFAAECQNIHGGDICSIKMR